MVQAKNVFLDTFDYVHDRLNSRLDGLTTEEYLWQPVPGCMTIRPTAGGYTMDRRLPRSDEALRFTTIAWRICHIGGEVLKGSAEALHEGRPSRSTQIVCPATANDAIRFLGEAFHVWRAELYAVDEERLWSKLGPSWGQFAEDTHAALVLHVLDELIHHGAEVGVLRDLYLHRFDAQNTE